eukprot:gnl/TRDRNA2_/TRDRNA2_37709_c0_seq1.p1 gnl/TRDRNA2_/TRDRNA2_37709_c0~~gnl/TRDRNA2_/TRDRNA2_37709_c0_seq1.p1  ORF type:complete len:411 (-),score=61.39 gnl/TRDRNA2_/TRDRNA2_37709_c0_seq1:53-1285(-)
MHTQHTQMGEEPRMHMQHMQMAMSGGHHEVVHPHRRSRQMPANLTNVYGGESDGKMLNYPHDDGQMSKQSAVIVAPYRQSQRGMQTEEPEIEAEPLVADNEACWIVNQSPQHISRQETGEHWVTWGEWSGQNCGDQCYNPCYQSMQEVPVCMAQYDMTAMLEQCQNHSATTVPDEDNNEYSEAIAPEDQRWGGITTVMLRNLPNKLSRRMLLDELRSAGFEGTYDFVYLPCDLAAKTTRGYAFLNFCTSKQAQQFRATFEGRAMSSADSTKIVSVVPATLQGYEANLAHYSSARVSRADPASRPLFLRDQAGTMSPADEASQRRSKQRGGRRNGPSIIDLASESVVQQVPPGPVRNVDGPVHKAGSVPAISPNMANYCPACGKKRAEDHQFCAFCGASLHLDAWPPQTQY